MKSVEQLDLKANERFEKARRCEMPKIVARIPEDIYRNINEEIKLGIFSLPAIYCLLM